jgi:5'(3')-deoxyribonucleotidase
MSKTVIAIDIDEVLAPFVSGLVAWHNQQYGTAYQFQDFNSYEFHKIWGGDRDQAIMKGTMHFETRGSTPPLPDAVQVLTRLAQRYDLIVVTSRMILHKPQTEAWINEHFPQLFQEIVLCNHWDRENRHPKLTKSAACQRLGAQYLIDDLPNYIHEAAGAGITGLLFGEYPWNRQTTTHPQVHRVKDWQAVEHYFSAP